MIQIPLNDNEWAQLDQEDKFDFLCDWFEQAMQAGQSPSAKAYSELVPAPLRAKLLAELMLLEQNYTQRRSITVASSSASTQSIRLGPTDTDFDLFHRRVASDEDRDESSDQFPVPFGKYVLRSLLGRGAFGDVFLAEHIETGASRAVKVPRAKLLADERDILLFQREAKNAGKLNHEHIVRVLDHGRFGGTPFLVSEYIEGKNLKDFLVESKRLAPRTAAFLMSDLAKAIHHAHSKGIIHRDVKPSNVLIENREANSSEETIEELRLKPKLLDFGISKVVSSNTLATLPGEILGTPAYMSPEQARGNSSEVTPASDVYSLGAMLYELLCGHPPFSGESSAITKRIQSEEVPPLLQLDKNIHIDLATIAHKALRLEPKDRYASAFDFAKELDRWLDGEPILARPLTRIARGLLYIKRHPKDLALKIAASLLIVSVGVLIWLLASARPSTIQPLIAHSPISQREADVQALRSWLGALPDALANPQPLWKTLDKQTSPYTLREIGKALSLHAESEPVLQRRLQETLGNGNREQSNLIACLIGYARPGTSNTARPPAELVDWLVRDKFSSDEVGWSDVARDLREPLLHDVAQEYVSATDPTERATYLRFLHSLVDQECCTASITALSCARLDELARWKNELDPYRDQAIQAIHTALDELGLEFSHDADGEETARRQSNLLLAAYMLGNTDRLWPSLSVIRDPRPRTYFAYCLEEVDGELDPLVARLDSETTPITIYGILLTLENIDQSRLSAENRAKLCAWVTHAYQNHPHGGVHTACRLLLRKWNQTTILQAIDEQLKAEGIVSGRDWYLNSLGMTMQIFRGPSKHRVPSYVTDADVAPKILWGEIEIPYTFAIASGEVTVAEYRQFQAEIKVPAQLREAFPNVPDNELPATGMAWRETANFSNWLSEREGLNPAIRFVDEENMETHLKEEGYRLPTRNEWNVALRGGSELELVHGSRWTSFTTPSSDSNHRDLAFPAFLSTRAHNPCGLSGGNNFPSEWTACKFNKDLHLPKSDPDVLLCRSRSGCIICGINSPRTTKLFDSGEFVTVASHANYRQGMRVVRTLK